MTTLSIEDLHAGYGKTQILRGVSLQAPPAQITCLLGRNGFGKSTTLKAIMGLISAQGSVKLGNKELAGASPHEVARAGIALVPQDRRIFPTLSVRENLAMGVKPKQVNSGALWSKEELLDAFPNLRTREQSPGRVLSGGEQQMLSVARAMMSNPSVVMLDEPTEGLSPLMVEALEKVIIESAKRGAAILLVESKLSIAMRLATEVYILWRGKAIPGGTPMDVKNNEKMRKEYLEI